VRPKRFVSYSIDTFETMLTRIILVALLAASVKGELDRHRQGGSVRRGVKGEGSVEEVYDDEEASEVRIYIESKTRT